MTTPSTVPEQITTPPAATGRLCHTIRYVTGEWQKVIPVDIEISIPGPVTTAAGTYDGITGEAQFLFATADGRLWHTIRYADGNWQPTGPVNSQISIPGPVAAISATGDGTAGETQFMYTTGGGTSLWHTTRLTTGQWTPPDPMNSKFSIPDPVTAVAATGDGIAGEAQFVVVTGGMLWHTTRPAGGNWTALGCVNDQLSPHIPAQPSIQAVAATYDDVLGEVQFIFTKSDGSVWRITRGTMSYTLENVTAALSLTSPVTTVAASGDGDSGEAQFLLVM